MRKMTLVLATLVGLGACGSNDGASTDGKGGGGGGGSPGTGGSSAHGGAGGAAGEGTGGATSSGGTTGEAGTTGAAGTTGRGGTTSMGGTGAGGSAGIGTGGSTSTGGGGGSGGASVAGAGGTTGVAGRGGAGGTASAGTSGTTGVAGRGGAGAGGTMAGGGSGGSAAGTGGTGTSNACPVDLVGFATLAGGTTGGGTTAPTTVRTQAELRTCATATGPRVCRVQGTLTFSPFEEIRVASDKTIIGAGANAEIVFGGFFLATGIHNVIIRNLTIRDSYIEGEYDEGGDNGGDRDGVQMDTADHVWIDHVHFHHLGDGMIDSRKDTTYFTASWNILEDHNKAFGIGWTDNVTAQMTIHHNWIHDTVQRNPSTDNVLRAHLYNNLMENISSYGNYARGATNMVLQNSTFVGVNDPHYYDTGTLVATGNVYRNTTGTRTSTGTTFSFFDPGTFYSYKLDSAADAEALVRRCAGPRAELGQ